MGDGFQGSEHVDIQPGAVNVPVSMRFRVSTGSTANTGAVPYGSTLVSSTVIAHLHDDTSVNGNAMVTATSFSSQIVTAYLSHSTTLVAGLYDLVAVTVFDLSGTTRQMTRRYDFDRVYVGNR
jgi:hypothetical protein